MRSLDNARKVSESDRQLLLELKSVVARFVPDASLILYGSAARGTRLPDSDYDVVIITDRRLSSLEQRELHRAVYQLELDRSVVLLTSVYSKDEWQSPLLRASPYWKNVTREGIVV